MSDKILAELDRSTTSMASKRAARALEEEDAILQGRESVRRLATFLTGMGAVLRGRIVLQIKVPPTGEYVEVQLRRPWSWAGTKKYRLSPSSSEDPDKLELLPLLVVLAGNYDLPKYEAYVVEVRAPNRTVEPRTFSLQGIQNYLVEQSAALLQA